MPAYCEVVCLLENQMIMEYDIANQFYASAESQIGNQFSK